MATIDYNLLKIFAAVSECQSFSGAAKRLGLPKSSVSRAVSALEQEVDVRLVHRTTRSVSLSSAGRALYERIVPGLDALNSAVNDLPDIAHEAAGVLRLTAPVDFGAMVLSEAVSKFVARYKTVQVDLRLTNANVDLVGEGLDLALRIANSPLKDSSLVRKRIGGLTLFIYGSSTYLAKHGTPRTVRELEAHEWVVFRALKTIKFDGESTKFTTNGRVACDEMSYVLQAVRQGAGLAILPNFLAEGDFGGDHLIRVMPKLSVKTGVLWAMYPSARHTPRKVTAFIEVLQETLRSHGIVTAGGNE